MNDSFINVKISHKFTGDVGGLRDYYDNWASRYNDDLADQKWVAPEVTADLVRAVATGYSPADPTILDAGCGTGLVGVGLSQRGFKTIDGIDLNEEMTRLARQTQAYRTLKGGMDLNLQGASEPPLLYDIVVSCGMFTHGHADPVALRSLIRYARPGGIVIASTRASYADATQFESFINDSVLGPDVELLSCLKGARYIDEEGGHYWVLRHERR